MSDEQKPDEPPDTLNETELVPSRPSESWEVILSRAEQSSPGDDVRNADATPKGNAKAAQWFKLLFPVLILLFYGIYKLVGIDYSRPIGPNDGIPRPAESLSGVPQQSQRDALALSMEAREFLAVLESHAARGAWREIASAVSAHQSEAVRDHPVVQALDSIARTRSGERSPALENRIKDLQITLHPAESRHPVLLQELRVAEVDQIINRTADPELLSRNVDRIIQLLDTKEKTAYEIEVRRKLARRFEDFGKSMMEEITLLNNDISKVRQARNWYQAGLRWVVVPAQWQKLTPLTPGCRAEVDDIVANLRLANRKLHGFSISLLGSDSETWSGVKGDPIHDQPSGGQR